ncbi:MAG: transglutaminaseTgpA domain-containing protein [Candidatus Wallbacteria bacterium]
MKNIIEIFKNKIYVSSVLMTVFMIFLPLYEKYAQRFFWASLYALGVVFYAVCVKDHKFSKSFLFTVRVLSFLYVGFLSTRYNMEFAVIGFLTIYQITRLMDRAFFANYIMTFFINLIILFLALPNHSGILIIFYILGFITLSINFLAVLTLDFHKNSFYNPAESEITRLELIKFTIKHYGSYVLVFTILIFILIPRIKLDFFRPGAFYFSGLSSVFNFQSIENIKQSDTVVMRVTLDHNYSSYYKMKAYNRYSATRREWLATNFGGRRIYPDGENKFIINNDTKSISISNGREINAVYYIKYNPDGFIPHIYHPLSIEAKLRSIYTDITENIYMNENESTIKVKSYLVNPDEEILRKSGNKDPKRVFFYFTMFDEKKLYRIKNIAERVTRNEKTRYDKVAAIENYLKNNFKYSLNVGDLYDEYRESPYDPNEVFLTFIKTGHCEFFASAMTLMCQSLGIPARLVSGYASPEYNENGNYFVIKNSDAHAWVEVYFPEIGFISFDPTPAGDDSAKSKNMIAALFGKYLDNFNFYIENYVSYYSNEYVFMAAAFIYDGMSYYARLAAAPFKNIAEANEAAYRLTGASFHARFGRKLLELWLFMALFLWFILAGRFKANIFKALSGLFGAEKSLRLIKIATLNLNSVSRENFYSRFLKVFAKIGIQKNSHETPYEFYKKISGLNKFDSKIMDNCLKISDYFYLANCAGQTLNREELWQIETMIMEISAKIKN